MCEWSSAIGKHHLKERKIRRKLKIPRTIPSESIPDSTRINPRFCVLHNVVCEDNGKRSFYLNNSDFDINIPEKDYKKLRRLTLPL